MNRQDLISKMAAKSVSEVEVEAYLNGNDLTAEDVETKMVDSIASAIVKGRPGAVAVGTVKLSTEVKPIAPVQSTPGRRQAGKSAAIARQGQVTQINGKRVIETRKAEAVQLEAAIAAGQEQADLFVTGKAAGFFSALAKGEEELNQTIEAVNGHRPEIDLDAMVVEAEASRASLFGNDFLASLLG